MKKTFISTSIAYINAEPHIGYLFELIAADVLARYHRLQGEEVFFLTGTDEHGIKNEQAARAADLEPQAYADKIAGKFKSVAEEFGVSFDHFVRTTDPKHIEFVQAAWQKLVAAQVIEKRQYQGLYCTGCEAFKTEREIKDGRCLIHETPVEEVAEENYYLKITDEAKSRINQWLETAVFPATKRQEVRNILEEFDGVSVSRPKLRLSWGVTVPKDPEQVMYVWTDALLNYLSGIEASGRSIEDFWPGTQIIGKDILKFHAIIWPALLLALEYPLPEKLLVHGFINVDGKKMSKSLGNVITPQALKERYGVEATRYLLLRQLSFYDDSNFVWSELDALYNGELANGIGNLVGRVVGILKKFPQKLLPVADQRRGDHFEFPETLRQINDFINSADQLVTRNKLWEETEKKESFIQESLNYLESARTALEPLMPETAKEIRRQLTELDPKPLFPRLT